MRRLFIICILLGCAGSVSAQQSSLYSQYIFNLFIVNPAYAGTRDALSLNAGYRAQWVGFEGAPTTQNFSIHSPLRKKNMSLGMQFQNDEIGARRATSFSGAYAYAIDFGGKRKLSFGLQGGMINYLMDWEALTFNERNDPAAYAIEPNKWIPNFDFGMMYITSKSYLGLSVTNLNRPGLSENELSDARLSSFVNLVGGKVYGVSKSVALKPGFLVRHELGGPVQFDLSLSSLFHNKVWLTTTYRYGFGMVASAHMYISEKFHFGYAYDWSMNNMATYQSGSHEIFIGYDISIYRSSNITPRYF